VNKPRRLPGSDHRGPAAPPRGAIAAREEIEHHLIECAERLVSAGWSPQEAKREAERRFGNISAVRAALESEIRRRQRWIGVRATMRILAKDTVHALRCIRRAPGFAATVTITLSVGIGGALAILQLVDAVLLRPFPVSDPKTLVGVFQSAARTTEQEDGTVTQVINRFNPLAYPNFLDLRDRSETLELAAVHTLSAGLHRGGQTALATVGVVSGNYFSVLGLLPKEGRLLVPSDETDPMAQPVTVLSSSFKQRFFGTDDGVGARIDINGESFIVVGVAPPHFRGTSLDAEVDAWIPVQQIVSIGAGGIFSLPDVLARRAFTWLSVLGRRRADRSTSEIESELNHVLNDLRAAYDDIVIAEHITRPLTVTPIAEAALVRGRDQLVRFLGLLLGIVAATFVVACANVANLFVTRGTYRQREFTVRRALGGSRARLASLVLVEGLIVSLLGAGLGIGAALGITHMISSFALPGGVVLRTLDLGVNPLFLATGFGLGVGASLLFALPPALVTSRNAATHLRGGRAVASGGPFNLLVAVQLALSLTLLAGAFLFTRSVHESLRVELGFDGRGVAAVSAGLRQHGVRAADAPSIIDEVLRVIEADPRVDVAGMASHVPLAPGALSMPITSEEGARQSMGVTTVAGRFFETLRIPLVEGTYLHEADQRDESVALVNQAAARALWPAQSALGKRFQLIRGIGEFFTVVGVVSTIANHAVTDEDLPYAYVSARQKPDLRFLEDLSVIARGSDGPQTVIPILRNTLQARLPGLPIFDARGVQEQVDMVLMPQRFGQRLLVLLGAIAVVVSAVGVYGLVAFAVSHQQRELGIRRALGARWNHLAFTVAARILRAGAMGIGSGILLLLVSTPLVSRFLVLVGPRDPIAIVVAASLLIGVTVLAVLPGARRASRIDPRIALDES
jgi:predicted permease